MSYIDEGYDQYMEKEFASLFADSDIHSQSPYDFDSYISDSSVGTAKIKELTADKIITGTLSATASINIGNGNVRMNDPSRTIIVNDGSYDRVLLGFLKDGF